METGEGMSIREVWQSYLREVLPADASPIQIQECRRAFYAGARAMWAIFETAPDEEPAVDAMLEALDREMTVFARTVADGGA